MIFPKGRELAEAQDALQAHVAQCVDYTLRLADDPDATEAHLRASMRRLGHMLDELRQAQQDQYWMLRGTRQNWGFSLFALLALLAYHFWWRSA